MPLSRVVRVAFVGGILGIVASMTTGCGGGKSPAAAEEKTAAAAKSDTGTNGDVPGEVPKPSRRKPAFGGTDELPGGNGTSRTSRPKTPNTPAAIRATLKPFQVIVGQWTGLARGSGGTEEPQWRWDFTNRSQPALAFEANDSSYLKSGRLTYLPETEEFRLIADTKVGGLKTYTGKLTEAVVDKAGDGKKLERTFTLTFTQVAPKPKTREPFFQVAFQQLKNDRYLMIIHKKTGSSLQQTARIANQRSGTSFAASLDDYGDKTCVVSQGLGTMTVSYNGKTYYVCCSGCKEAFEAEPAKWVASFEKWKKENGKR